MSDKELGKERGEIIPHRQLVEIAGTPYWGKYKDITGISDPLIEDYNGPRILGFDAEIEYTYTSPVYIEHLTNLVIENIGALVETRTPEGRRRYMDQYRENMRDFWKQTLKDEQLIASLDRILSQIVSNTSQENYLTQSPKRQQPDLIVGGIFDTLTLVEVFRSSKNIDEETANSLNQKLLIAAPKEDIVIVTLISPDAIERTKPQVPHAINPLNLRSLKPLTLNMLYNEIYSDVRIAHKESFGYIEIIDLTEPTSQMKTRREIADLVDESTAQALLPFLR
jgi:hypothetical protein